MTPKPLIRATLMAALLCSVSACATAPSGPSATADIPRAIGIDQAALALQTGDHATALKGFGDAAARDPSDAARQTLLGMTYQAAAQGDPEQLDLALAGYDLALRSGQDAFWAAALAGKAAFDRGRYAQAQSYYARAVMMRPDDARALLGLAMSAYMAGDPQLAALSAERAAALSSDPALMSGALKIGALSYAATGRRDQAAARYQKLILVAPEQAAPVKARMEELTRTEATDPVPEAATRDPGTPDQVSVDVAIILSQNAQRDSIGLNLLDGLQIQYGRQDQQTHAGSDTGVSRTITDTITLPQLTYNLNLFNRFGQYYQVVARPMLTAYRGEPSDFFVGRSTKVAVKGVNFSQLENIDIGTQVKVTPLEITAEGTRLKIEVTRSFLSGEPAGNFNEALNTWRQTVSTTVEVKFGTTLILSGLSESVRDSSVTKTPLLGDAPVIGSAFNRRVTNERRDAVLVLVTPAPAQAIQSTPWARPADVERLIGLWGTTVAPGSDLGAITGNLSRSRLFTRARKTDAQLSWPSLPHDQGEILKDLILP
ncbi:secretion protein [Asticcacaulis sp. BYS171W]|uniref:Secretion protein n=1 Tax=Asticcacaulis aquaticus TaxID=2984212 RepID=A0ABT5HXK5_9CAUL|nr:tetratricopeptide repeat protein [Asticcacaulis aquaticus]MDC7684590.1 secretion protein [Asticcacaulis aquaticus]